ncbi:PREDICTED: uncharacterized protein LOC108557503 [Nicrophorus vespilloides]|uniref:Uncharacterized protein LOC108557503 n=1 Tax=Nicrophorus vespilloides TaxID=110193 RepID=A0ABM1M4L7_NICVS|nr:PREDICTED: uncharacterized protein LOC108557503 [Nicrophorus vespilloides]
MYTKNRYHPIVKNSDWHHFYESLPIDNNPYCKYHPDLNASHYDHLGQEKCICYATEMSDMMRQLELKDNYINRSPDKKVINYFSFKDTTSCDAPNYSMFPTVCADNYVSTMQKSYKTSYPYKMHRISIPKRPFMETRKVKKEDPTSSMKKFYDEDCIETIKLLQKHKAHRFNSYDFCKGHYQDGTVPLDENKRR